MQKYFDQAISGNWSYNTENYTDGQVFSIYNGTRFIDYI